MGDRSFQWAVDEIQRIADQLRDVAVWLGSQGSPQPAWAFPVGTMQYPPKRWYAACLHDLTGRLNDGYPHTGIDLNLNVKPWGDVDRGMPVWSVASGIIRGIGYSQSYLGSVIVEVEHISAPLYVRYWHLANDATFRGLVAGQIVQAGQQIGAIGNYTLGAGGDHCHLDMKVTLYKGPHCWFTTDSGGWIDPVPVLKAHLPVAEIEAMLSKAD